jgi:predicted short-subunit dehydrogenase-like oxidoreductase (DUF2520 family)
MAALHATLTNPDAPEAAAYQDLQLVWPAGGRWSEVTVRRDARGTYHLTANNGPHLALTLSSDSLADLEAAVEDLNRALAAFSLKLAAEAAEAAEAGEDPGPPAGPAPEEGADQ